MLATLNAESTENAEANDPIEAILPEDPIDNTERELPMLRNESWDAIDHAVFMLPACTIECLRLMPR